MAEKFKDIIEKVEKLTVVELSELIKEHPKLEMLKSMQLFFS